MYDVDDSVHDDEAHDDATTMIRGILSVRQVNGQDAWYGKSLGECEKHRRGKNFMPTM